MEIRTELSQGVRVNSESTETESSQMSKQERSCSNTRAHFKKKLNPRITKHNPDVKAVVCFAAFALLSDANLDDGCRGGSLTTDVRRCRPLSKGA